MKNRNFVSFLAFTCDVLEEIAWLSRNVQENTPVLMGQRQRLNILITRLQHFKAGTPGSQLSRLLAVAQCSNSNSDPQPCDTLETFESSVTVKYLDVTLTNKQTTYKHLSTVRPALIDTLVSGLDVYLPARETVAIDALTASSLPDDPSKARGFQLPAIVTLAESFNLDSDSVVDQWQNLLELITGKPELLRFRESGSDLFWAIMLGSSQIDWTNFADIRKLIQISLALPVGSVDAERGFSILKHTAYDRRSSLGDATLDSILRLRINGPEIADFVPLPYVKAWELAGNFLSDSKTHSTVSLTEKERRMLQDIWSERDESSMPWKKLLKKTNLF